MDTDINITTKTLNYINNVIHTTISSDVQQDTSVLQTPIINTNNSNTILDTTTQTTTTSTLANGTTININKQLIISFDNEHQTTFFTKTDYGKPNSASYRNLIYKIGLGENALSKAHIPTISLLYSIGVCPKCIYRFLNVNNISIYQESYETSLHTINYLMLKYKKESENSKETELLTKQSTTTTPKTKSTQAEQHQSISSIYNPNSVELKQFVCSCCLGILQDIVNKELFLDELIKKIKESDHEYKDYSLAIEIPNSIIIRQFSIAYYLEDSFPNLYGSKHYYNWEVVDIRHCAKWILPPIISRVLSIKFAPNNFRVNLDYKHKESENEHQFLLDIESDRKPTKKQKTETKAAKKRSKLPPDNSRNHIMDLLESTSKQDLKFQGTVPPHSPKSKYYYKLTFSHKPIYLTGKYNKYVRDLSQIPSKNSNTDSSVQELICKNIKSLFKSDTIIFKYTGSEDKKVRMLNDGRPFCIEIINPLRVKFTTNDYNTLQQSINISTGKIEVKELQFVTKKQTESIIEHSYSAKYNNYRCIAWTNKVLVPSDLNTLNSMAAIHIKQTTPISELPRHVLKTSNKKISKLVATFISPHFFMLDTIGVEPGTYIKEFIHGDLGRTTPNIGQLLGDYQADVLQLDVLKADLDSPTTTTAQL